jgi:CelD/BcsL family acetyltransferase involved in cellulose biosynthesis
MVGLQRRQQRQTIETLTELGPLAEEWNRLALDAGTPFMSAEWLGAWSRAFGEGDSSWTVLRDADGSIRAGACCRRAGFRRLASTTNEHGHDWEILARDDDARAELCAALVDEATSRVALAGMIAGGPSALAITDELERAGYRVLTAEEPCSPWLDLPGTWDELIQSVSGSLRSQIGRRRRTLEREGQLTFRVAGEPGTLKRDLDTFLKLESSGWKGRDGTAIASQPSIERLYREFAAGAAEQGWLRLYLLELDGVAIAADYGCAFAGTGIFMKTGFDESYSRFSPGLVLRADVLRSSIEENLSAYDFLGQPDTYKTRWTSAKRPRLHVWAYRGEALPGSIYRKRVRPALKSARDRMLRLRGTE